MPMAAWCACCASCTARLEHPACAIVRNLCTTGRGERPRPRDHGLTWSYRSFIVAWPSGPTTLITSEHAGPAARHGQPGKRWGHGPVRTARCATNGDDAMVLSGAMYAVEHGMRHRGLLLSNGSGDRRAGGPRFIFSPPSLREHDHVDKCGTAFPRPLPAAGTFGTHRSLMA
jgi:hypothetical protein